MIRGACALLAATAAVEGSAVDAVAQHSVWPVDQAVESGYPYDVPYGGHPPGGYERRVGSPYYWSVPGGTKPLDARNAGVVAHGDSTGVTAYDPAVGIHAAAANRHAFDTAGPESDPYSYHFGPGFYRSNEFGHYRFPYYSYRRPWYDVGHPVRVRDTNLPW